MINRDMVTVQVISYTNAVDSYGQRKLTTSSTSNTQMALYLSSQQLVQDPRYIDCEYIGLTSDKSITDDKVIKYNNIEYQILKIIPSRRYTQVFLRKKK